MNGSFRLPAHPSVASDVYLLFLPVDPYYCHFSSLCG
eukprot:COSAG02_NODE_53311_length_302_cov_1.266010_1_plen_36_part_10